MKKPKDRVTEAYFDKLGKEFGKQTRDRIHWMCSQAVGNKVLDVGCSQGITSILLAREGKRVLGLDLIQESIEEANDTRDRESEVVRELIEFKTGNFLTWKFNDEKFDTILFGEVLEHVTKPELFLDRASSLLNENGRVIITLPFGINDYFDHKKTYYLAGLFRLKNDLFNITRIKFFGKWIGVVYELPSSGQNIKLDYTLLATMEESFYKLERNLLDELKNKNSKIAQLENQLAEVEKKHLRMLETVKKNTEEMSNIILNSGLGIIQQDQVEKLMKELLKEKQEKLSIKQELADQLKSEEELLRKYKRLQNKYNSLSRSKFGRITLFYWNFMKRLRGRKQDWK